MLSKLFAKFTKKDQKQKQADTLDLKDIKNKVKPERIGELGEYKINIQLDQMDKQFKYVSDLLIDNPKSKTRYSQIDHVVITPYAIFVIETKNYQGTIYGERNRTKWNVNGKFPMMNPFNQNFGHIQAIKSLLKCSDSTNFVSIVSFSRRCTFKVNEELRKIHSNDLIVYDTELSDIIKRKINVLKLQPTMRIFTDEEIQTIYTNLTQANITDERIREEHINLIKEAIVKPKNVNAKSNSKCAICSKNVSEKVVTYCLTNKEKFNGKIYCFDHQK